MLIGIHISSAGSLTKIPQRAYQIGAECFQFFTRSPRGGKIIPITLPLAKTFKQECKKFKFTHYYVHTPYFINLASANNQIYQGSIEIIKTDLKRANKLGADYVITHLGSAKDVGIKPGLQKIIYGLSQIFKDYQGQTQLLLENSAGAGQIIGDKFEDLSQILYHQSLKNYKKYLGVCFDTAHAFQSGYDLKTKLEINKILGEFDKIIGLNNLKLIHLNDSKTGLSSHVDRHWHIGRGRIGLEGFKALLAHPCLKNINVILETPGKLGSEWDRKNIKVLKKIRGN